MTHQLAHAAVFTALPVMRNIARRILSSRRAERIEDVLQDAVCAGLEFLQTHPLRNEAAAVATLLTIVRRKAWACVYPTDALDFAVSMQECRMPPDDQLSWFARCTERRGEGESWHTCEPNREQTLLDAERRQQVGRLLNVMRPAEREILQRFYFEEQPADQIRLEMDLTRTQYRLLKSRAKARLTDRFRQAETAAMKERK